MLWADLDDQREGEEEMVCRESQTKGKEAAAKWPNGSNEVKTEGGSVMQGHSG